MLKRLMIVLLIIASVIFDIIEMSANKYANKMNTWHVGGVKEERLRKKK